LRRRISAAVSQGIIGRARAGDAATLRWVVPLETARRAWPQAPSALLRRIEGGCQVPLGALQSHRSGARLEASVCSLDGRESVSARGAAPATIEEAVALGERVADELLAAVPRA
jgi:hydroxymethylbilane synthase